MKNNSRTLYLFFISGLLLFFLLHGINEHFGLIPLKEIFHLFLYYSIVTAGVVLLSKLVYKDWNRTVVYSFFLLLLFFFFGVFKDLMKDGGWLQQISSYRYLLPAGFLLVAAVTYLLYKTESSLRNLAMLAGTIVMINLLVELSFFFYHSATRKDLQQDFGDRNNELAKGLQIDSTSEKPLIFWIVMDEYSSSAMLRKYWDFSNPLDTFLTTRGFFVADSAESSYNYTQYSLLSSLDMNYISEFENRNRITYKDIVRAHYSLYRNNVVEVLHNNGYQVSNYSVSDFENFPASPLTLFALDRRMLIDNQTFPGRVSLDIGWNFRHLFRNAGARDSLFAVETYRELDRINDATYKNMMERLQAKKSITHPELFVLHTMFSHDPFIYDADGSLNIQDRLGILPHRYIPSIQYTNTVVGNMIDSILQWYAGKKIVIVLQGDHGFKFKEGDPAYEKDMCKIFYAVYCSDGAYPGWTSRINTVNTFRVLFNKYFSTALPLLPNKTYPLYYR